MIIKNVSGEDLSKALAKVNEKYDNNVIWNNYQKEGNRFRVTLRVIDSHGKGARLSQSTTSKGNRRHLISACWHIHGDFFDELLNINQNAIIQTSITTIDKHGGNWTDRNIGSMINPLYYSEACECEFGS